MTALDQSGRRIGLVGAIGIGVGAIVGGGILALAGVAFALTGPGAILVFALNGVIAIITALSFAELATAFPQSGGPYLYAKRVLSVGAAFGVGWVVWFASIVAAALYAVGFSAFALEALRGLWGEGSPAWLSVPGVVTLGGVLTMLGSAAIVVRSSGGGGILVNLLKVLVFGVLIVGGIWVWIGSDPPVVARLTPLMPAGPLGLLQAMGATFIALQGFGLIATVAGQIKDPRRVIPQAMLWSLGVALAIYLPLLLVVLVVGVVPGQDIQAMAAERPDTVLATAVRHYLGSFGYWLVLLAGVLSMYSALLANLFAAASIAQAMARDRTLSSALERVHPNHGTPWLAIVVTALIAALSLLVVGDVAAAGAASSLIFLLAFALCHALCVVTRKRQPDHPGFRVPWWPWLPILGGLTCGGLAIYQALTVPAAGAVTAVWLVVGGIAYAWHFGRRARVFDAASEAVDPDLLELRGRSPLVLVPVANPENAEVMAQVAGCLAPPRMGRVLLLSVVRPPRDGDQLETVLSDSAQAVQQSLGTALRAGVRCEALATVAAEPWPEFARVAGSHRCASVLLGLSDLSDGATVSRLEDFATHIDANTVFLRAPPEWSPSTLQRVLVPIGGRSVHDALRARLLAGLHRRASAGISVTYLLVDPLAADPQVQRRRHATAVRLVRDETSLPSEVVVVPGGDVTAAILSAATSHDLILLGMGKAPHGRRILGPISRGVIAGCHTAVMLVSEAS